MSDAKRAVAVLESAGYGAPGFAADLIAKSAAIAHGALLTPEEAQEIIASAPAYLSAGLYAKLKRIAGDS